LYIDSKDNKIINELNAPEFKSALQLARKWYNEGYVRKDVATYTGGSEDLKKGSVFAWMLSTAPYALIDFENRYGYKVVEIPITQPITQAGQAMGSLNAITSSCKEPERAMMFLDLLNSDKYVANIVRYGIENKHYVKVDDKNIKPAPDIDPKSPPYRIENGWQLGNLFLNYYMPGVPNDKWEKYKEYNKSAIVSPNYGFTYNPDNVKSEIASCVNVWKEFAPALATGTVDPDEYLPKMLEKYKIAGIDKILADEQKQFDAFLASKNK
jgi:putative aldouronate transport system substrate-binding protein